MPSLLIVEDDPILRDFLVQEARNNIMLGFENVQYAAALKEAHAQIDISIPDAMLLDLKLPDGSGVELVERLSRLSVPQNRIIVLTGQIDQHVLPLELHPHIHSVVSKSDGLSPLRHSLYQLAQILEKQKIDLSCLSPRQIEILSLLGKGLDTAEIAQHLGITFSTAQTHRRQITSRLGIKGIGLLDLARSFYLNKQ